MRSFPEPPGKLVDLGGFRLHGVVRGMGTPTIVFEPALGGFALQYAKLQAVLADQARVITYDRAGQGWSDASPNERIPVNYASELHMLLHALDLLPPYILVGHSFGGLLVRIFAGLHPDEVAGVVLIDAAHIDQYETFPSVALRNVDKMVRQTAMGVGLLKFIARLGLARTLTRLSLGSSARAFEKDDLELFLDIASQPKHHETLLAEISQHQHLFGAQSEVPRSLGDLPLLVIAAGSSLGGYRVKGVTAEQLSAWHMGIQKDLMHLSTRSELVVIPGATHLSILTQQDHSAAVVMAIGRMIERVRANE